mmetsp:Transcript_6369/g.7294  ORF Transcript_6369/g.7294 Transcript_6369/m.7294 type:complete len:281 (-) Transcript_6369:35-877(-)
MDTANIEELCLLINSSRKTALKHLRVQDYKAAISALEKGVRSCTRNDKLAKAVLKESKLNDECITNPVLEDFKDVVGILSFCLRQVGADDCSKALDAKLQKFLREKLLKQVDGLSKAVSAPDERIQSENAKQVRVSKNKKLVYTKQELLDLRKDVTNETKDDQQTKNRSNHSLSKKSKRIYSIAELKDIGESIKSRNGEKPLTKKITYSKEELLKLRPKDLSLEAASRDAIEEIERDLMASVNKKPKEEFRLCNDQFIMDEEAVLEEYLHLKTISQRNAE